MQALRKACEELGFRNVTTYVQSGNLIFSGEEIEPKDLSTQLSRQFKSNFGFDIPIITLKLVELQNVIDNNPFSDDKRFQDAFKHVTFVSSKPDNPDLQAIEEKKQSGEEIAFSNHAVYLYCPKGYGRTKLNNNFLESRLGVIATTRNWKTTNKLLEIAKEIS